jgi:tetratricopeptide (TPR) repeat protein
VNLFGLVARNLGRLDEASQLLERALQGRERIPNNDSEINETLELLGAVRQDQGDLQAAWELNEQALASWERLLGPDHPQTLRVVENLGSIAFQRLDALRCIELHIRLRDSRERLLGPMDPSTIVAVRALAAAKLMNGADDDAMALLDTAYARNCQLYGADDPRSTEVIEEQQYMRDVIRGSGGEDN